jgi:hypothetical protein
MPRGGESRLTSFAFSSPQQPALASAGDGCRRLAGFNQRHVDQMFAEEPDLKLVGAKDLTDDQVIRPIVANFGSAAPKRSSQADDDSVGIEQSRQLNRDLFPSPWRPFDPGGLRHIRRHRQAYSPEQLNTFGDRVNQLDLLAIVFVVQQMELIESRTGNLPVRLFVQVANSHRVGEQLVQLLGHLEPHRLFEVERQCVSDCAVRLDFTGTLMQVGLCADF